MLRTEQNTPAMKRRVLKAARKKLLAEKLKIEAYFSHYGTQGNGQWFIETNGYYGPTQYSVEDATGPGSIDGFDFEKL